MNVDDVFDALLDSTREGHKAGSSSTQSLTAPPRDDSSPRVSSNPIRTATGLKERKLNNCGAWGMDVEGRDDGDAVHRVDATITLRSAGRESRRYGVIEHILERASTELCD